jgi:hypothetical protein
MSLFLEMENKMSYVILYSVLSLEAVQDMQGGCGSFLFCFLATGFFKTCSNYRSNFFISILFMYYLLFKICPESI